MDPNTLTPLDMLILKIVQFDHDDQDDIVSMSYRNIQDKLEEYAKGHPQLQSMILGENGNPPSVSTISKRVRGMKEAEIIKYPMTAIDCSKLGYREMLLIYLKTKLHPPIQQIMNDLERLEELNVIYQISGDYPIFCMSKCADKNHQIQLLERVKAIDGIDDVTTSVVLKKAKEDMRAIIDINNLVIG